ncbi:MAG: DUF763 domain-containing protein [Treponema sp.]|nr:DUF763 domain-containing protein [Treponema sp.]
MPRNSGHADLPLHTGTVPRWLADRMMVMGTLITESLVENFGVDEVLVRLSDPLWFQSFGAVMGMDWHSSGITTSVLYALKRGLNPRAEELGLYVCGGRGKYSRMTPDELLSIADKTGLDGDILVRNSKLVAKVDNNAVQDGFQLYQHNFILSKTGSWTVVQQGMNVDQKKARRYHWSSENLRSFVEQPHTGVVGENRGQILNLTDTKADSARTSILEMSRENPDRMIHEITQIGQPANQIILLQNGKVGGESLPLASAGEPSSATPSSGGKQKGDCDPRNAPAPKPEQGLLFPELETSSPQSRKYPDNSSDSSFACKIANGASTNSSLNRNYTAPLRHQVLAQDVDLKRLGGVLATAYQSQPQDFESLLLTPGLGPRTLQSLALVSEVIYGTPTRFTDPARFSFAHGGKDGHPFPVPLKIYDESIRILRESIEKSKLGYKDKSDCICRLYNTALAIEQNCNPQADFDAAIRYEWEHSKEFGGKTV